MYYSLHTARQGKKAQGENTIEPRLTDARPLISGRQFSVTSTFHSRVELMDTESSGQENEDQSLFRLSLLRELSCNDQGRRSE